MASTILLLITLIISLAPTLANPTHTPIVKYFPVPRPHLPPPPQEPPIASRTCGTLDPPVYLRDKLINLRMTEPLENNTLWSPAAFSACIFSQPLHKRAENPLITIPTYFHVVADPNATAPGSPNYISDVQLEAQLGYLQQSYAPLSVAFTLLNTTRTTNALWASNTNDLNMKRTLRQGTYNALNIYFQSHLRSDGSDDAAPGTILLGFCTLPFNSVTTSTPPDLYVRDGCNVLSSSAPGGSLPGYNLGGTAVHEIGHWLGLLHTFQDQTCDAHNFGDYVADTPQQSVATRGCPERGSQDSCPLSGAPEGWTGAEGQGPNPYGPQGYAGVDSTRNFMDYSSDGCYEGWTAGQGARIVNGWGLWRKGR